MTNEEFKAIIIPQYRYMYRVATSVMRSDSEAADVVQDVMLKLYEKREQLDNVKDIKSFCIQAIRNACLNIIRRRKEYLTPEEVADINSSEDIHNDLEWRDMSDMVGRIIRRLPKDQLKVFKLSAFGGFSNVEIAEILGLSQGNVRVLLNRARKIIKESFSK